MKKSILYRLFRIGKIPKHLKRELASERIDLEDEGIGGWIVTKKFKAPGKRFYYHMKGFTGFLVVTRRRIVAYGFRSRLMNLPLDDPKTASVEMALPDPERIEFRFEASVFHPEWSGGITLRFNTSNAKSFYELLREKTRMKLK